MSEENVSLPVAQALASALAKIEAYVPTEYVDNSEPDLDAEHLNHAEQGIMRVTNLLNAAVDVIQGQESRLTDAETKIGTAALTGGMTDLSSGLNELKSNMNALTDSSISIPSGSPVTGNRAGAKIYQNSFLVLSGEVGINFTNLKNWTGYNILQCANGSKYTINFIATDENGGSFHMQIDTNGIIKLSIRGYMPENKSQILRFFCITPIGA
nr:MAG TPA: hypothetical protein [Bacteriophage sp.]